MACSTSGSGSSVSIFLIFRQFKNILPLNSLITMSIGMKRPSTFSNLGVGYGNMRAQCVESSKIRLLVLTEYAGYMIGRGGENVRRLRTKYNVNINGLDRQGKEVAVLQITGPRDAAIEAIAELLPLCPKAYFVSGKHHRTHDVNLWIKSFADFLLYSTSKYARSLVRYFLRCTPLRYRGAMNVL